MDPNRFIPHPLPIRPDYLPQLVSVSVQFSQLAAISVAERRPSAGHGPPRDRSDRRRHGGGIGNLGALVAQVPLRMLVEHFGWRSVSIGSGGVMVAVGLIAWAVVRDDPAERGGNGERR